MSVSGPLSGISTTPWLAAESGNGIDGTKCCNQRWKRSGAPSCVRKLRSSFLKKGCCGSCAFDSRRSAALRTALPAEALSCGLAAAAVEVREEAGLFPAVNATRERRLFNVPHVLQYLPPPLRVRIPSSTWPCLQNSISWRSPRCIRRRIERCWFSEAVTGSKWAGLTHALQEQRWSSCMAAGISPTNAAYETRCAKIVRPSIDMWPYPWLPVAPSHSQQPELGSGIDRFRMRSCRVTAGYSPPEVTPEIAAFLSGAAATRWRCGTTGCPELPTARRGAAATPPIDAPAPIGEIRLFQPPQRGHGCSVTFAAPQRAHTAMKGRCSEAVRRSLSSRPSAPKPCSAGDSPPEQFEWQASTAPLARPALSEHPLASEPCAAGSTLSSRASCSILCPMTVLRDLPAMTRTGERWPARHRRHAICGAGRPDIRHGYERGRMLSRPLVKGPLIQGPRNEVCCGPDSTPADGKAFATAPPFVAPGLPEYGLYCHGSLTPEGRESRARTVSSAGVPPASCTRPSMPACPIHAAAALNSLNSVTVMLSPAGRGRGVGRLRVGEFKEHVGVARLIDRAPAREVLAAQFTEASGDLGQETFRDVLRERLRGAIATPRMTVAVIPVRAGAPVWQPFSPVVRVAPFAGPADIDSVWWHPPAARALTLNAHWCAHAIPCLRARALMRQHLRRQS